MHALILAIGFGLLFTAGVLLLGPALYHALGGEGAALDAAIEYSTFVFIGSVPAWVMNLLAAALRGAGNVRVPAILSMVGAAIMIPLSPAFIFGFGPIPRFGIAGAGIAVTIYYALAAIALIYYLVSGRSGLVLKRVRIESRLFRDVLRVGLISAIGTIQPNLTVVVVTGVVGMFGADALAGYGIASRLDYVLIPIMFGLGTGVVTMVGTNMGAGHLARAKRVAWTGAFLGFVVAEIIGAVAAIAPDALASSVQPRSGCDCHRLALFAHGRADLWCDRCGDAALFRSAGRRAGALAVFGRHGTPGNRRGYRMVGSSRMGVRLTDTVCHRGGGSCYLGCYLGCGHAHRRDLAHRS